MGNYTVRAKKLFGSSVKWSDNVCAANQGIQKKALKARHISGWGVSPTYGAHHYEKRRRCDRIAPSQRYSAAHAGLLGGGLR